MKFDFVKEHAKYLIVTGVLIIALIGLLFLMPGHKGQDVFSWQFFTTRKTLKTYLSQIKLDQADITANYVVPNEFSEVFANPALSVKVHKLQNNQYLTETSVRLPAFVLYPNGDSKKPVVLKNFVFKMVSKTDLVDSLAESFVSISMQDPVKVLKEFGVYSAFEQLQNSKTYSKLGSDFIKVLSGDLWVKLDPQDVKDLSGQDSIAVQKFDPAKILDLIKILADSVTIYDTESTENLTTLYAKVNKAKLLKSLNKLAEDQEMLDSLGLDKESVLRMVEKVEGIKTQNLNNLRIKIVLDSQGDNYIVKSLSLWQENVDQESLEAFSNKFTKTFDALNMVLPGSKQAFKSYLVQAQANKVLQLGKIEFDYAPTNVNLPLEDKTVGSEEFLQGVFLLLLAMQK